MTRVFERIEDWLRVRDTFSGKSLGLVPTMGALHQGHASLVRRSKAENDFTLVTIFVNPTQFNDPKDLEKYPKTLEADLALLRGLGADFVLYPDYKTLYPDQYRYRVNESEFSSKLCGAHRPGHFDGVLTVVMKLLNIAGAERAYFGEKDYQQLLLVEGMAEAFFMKTKIVACPTVRESDGLAMSSRNTRLTASERERASAFPKFLNAKAPVSKIKDSLKQEGFEVDYVEEHQGRRFGAVRIGEVRLIDNVEI